MLDNVIRLIKAFPYDNNYDYIKMFSSEAAQETYFNSLNYEDIDETNYKQVNNTFNVALDYDYLDNEGVNYVIFNNGYRDIYAFVIKKEYLKKNLTRLIYEVDVIQTYMHNFTVGQSFIERKVCDVSEILDFDEGIDIGEHYIANKYDMITKEGHYFAMFSGFKDYHVANNVMTELPMYNSSRPITTIDGIVYPFMLIALDTDIGINTFYKYLVDLPNLLGVIRFPKCIYNVTTVSLPLVKIESNNIVKDSISCPKVVTSVVHQTSLSETIPIPKSSITDFYPYTYYVLTDGEADALILQPQYLQDSLTILGTNALSHTPVERYYPTYYKGDTSGNVYNITNTSVMMLPTGTNGGIETATASALQIQQQKSSMIGNILVGVAVGAVGLATGGVGLALGAAGLVGGLASGFNSVKENIARNKDLELTPSTIKSFGTPSTRDVFGNNSVRVLKCTIKDEYKARLLNYVNRYGNKFNNYGTINLKSYNGFIKYLSPDIDSNIDNIYITKIKEILERGVYIE